MLWFMQAIYTQASHFACCVVIAECIKYEFSQEDFFFFLYKLLEWL